MKQILIGFILLLAASLAMAHENHSGAEYANSIVSFTPNVRHELSKADQLHERELTGIIHTTHKGNRPIRIVQPAGAFIRDLEPGFTYTLALGEVTAKKGDYFIIEILSQTKTDIGVKQ
jgi:hypothetical protein